MGPPGSSAYFWPSLLLALSWQVMFSVPDSLNGVWERVPSLQSWLSWHWCVASCAKARAVLTGAAERAQAAQPNGQRRL